MIRLAALALLPLPALAEPPVAPLDPGLDPLAPASACPMRAIDLARDVEIALIVGPEGLETDRDLRAMQHRICERRGLEG